MFKVDRLETKTYVLEFGASDEGLQQSPFIIEGQSLLPSPALTFPTLSKRPSTPMMFHSKVAENVEVSQF